MQVSSFKQGNVKPTFCRVCGKRVGSGCKQCKKCYNESRPNYSSSLSAAEIKFKNLPAHLQAVVFSITSRYKTNSIYEKRAILLEAIAVVEAAVNCQGRCCREKSLDERLEDL